MWPAVYLGCKTCQNTKCKIYCDNSRESALHTFSDNAMPKKKAPKALQELLRNIEKLPPRVTLPDLSSRLLGGGGPIAAVEQTHRLLYAALTGAKEFSELVWSAGAWDQTVAEVFSSTEPDGVLARLADSPVAHVRKHPEDCYRNVVMSAVDEYEFVRQGDIKLRQMISFVAGSRVINRVVSSDVVFIKGHGGLRLTHLLDDEDNWRPVALPYKDRFSAVFDLDEEDLPDLRYLRICPNPDCGRVFWAGRLLSENQTAAFHSSRCRNLISTRNWRASHPAKPVEKKPASAKVIAAVERRLLEWPKRHRGEPFTKKRANIRELAALDGINGISEISESKCVTILNYLESEKKRATPARKR